MRMASNTITLITLFGDLIESSRLADVLPREGCQNIYQNFREVFDELRNEFQSKDRLSNSDNLPFFALGEECRVEVRLRGDGDRYVPGRKSEADLIYDLLSFAARLQTAWLASKTNKDCQENGCSLVWLAIGVHIADTDLDRPQGGHGYGSIYNFAKRVETASRVGKATGITVSQTVVNRCRELGIPLRIGEALSVESKGFYRPQPIYEITSVVDLIFEEVTKSEDGGKFREDELSLRSHNAGYLRDPRRFVWHSEIRVARLFYQASQTLDETTATKLFDQAQDAARDALTIENSGTIQHWAGRIAHRRRNPAKSKKQDDAALSAEIDFIHGVNHYRAAASEPNSVWAEVDLIATYWKRARELDDSTDRRDEATQLIQVALDLCERFEGRLPLYSYTYNLHALLLADSVKMVAHERAENVLRRAEALIEIAKRLNPKLQLIYSGTLMTIRVVRCLSDPQNSTREDMATKVIEDLKGNIQQLSLNSDTSLSFRDYWQAGHAAPGTTPPRPKQLINQWNAQIALIEKLKP